MTNGEEKGKPSEPERGCKQERGNSRENAPANAADTAPVEANDEHQKRSKSEQPANTKHENRGGAYRLWIGRESLVMLGFSALLVVVGFFEILLLWNQNTQMIAQTSQMTVQSEQMKKQSISMDGQLRAMGEQNRVLADQTAKMADQIKLADLQLREATKANQVAETAANAAKASVELATKANNTAEESAKAASHAALAAVHSNDIADDAAQNQLRAYVSLTSVSKLEFEPGANAMHAMLTIKNAGQTPAYKIKTRSAMLLRPLDFKGPFDLSTEPLLNGTEMTAAPGREWTINIRRPLDKPGKLSVWVFGEILYRDAFGKLRFTNFRFRNGDQTAGTNTYDLNFENEGNDSN